MLDEGTRVLRTGKCIDDLLEDLACRVLCTRDHQYQAPELVVRWRRQICESQATRSSVSILNPEAESDGLLAGKFTKKESAMLLGILQLLNECLAALETSAPPSHVEKSNAPLTPDFNKRPTVTAIGPESTNTKSTTQVAPSSTFKQIDKSYTSTPATTSVLRSSVACYGSSEATIMPVPRKQGASILMIKEGMGTGPSNRTTTSASKPSTASPNPSDATMSPISRKQTGSGAIENPLMSKCFESESSSSGPSGSEAKMSLVPDVQATASSAEDQTTSKTASIPAKVLVPRKVSAGSDISQIKMPPTASAIATSSLTVNHTRAMGSSIQATILTPIECSLIPEVLEATVLLDPEYPTVHQFFASAWKKIAGCACTRRGKESK